MENHRRNYYGQHVQRLSADDRQGGEARGPKIDSGGTAQDQRVSSMPQEELKNENLEPSFGSTDLAAQIFSEPVSPSEY